MFTKSIKITDLNTGKTETANVTLSKKVGADLAAKNFINWLGRGK
jgi:hypothetical protein